MIPAAGGLRKTVFRFDIFCDGNIISVKRLIGLYHEHGNTPFFYSVQGAFSYPETVQKLEKKNQVMYSL